MDRFGDFNSEGAYTQQPCQAAHKRVPCAHEDAHRKKDYQAPATKGQMETRKLIYTCGTSNRTLEQFLAMLISFSIRYAVDVRRFPDKSRYPHFHLRPLREALKSAGICHIWLGDSLGGYRREPYQDFMRREIFARGIRALEFLGSRGATCFFCAEAFWGRCHRRFIADVLVRRGWCVLHITSKKRTTPHPVPLFGEEGDA